MSRAESIRLIIVSGISGSGTSTALRALEDIGFFSVNNLPANLLDRFVEQLLGQCANEGEHTPPPPGLLDASRNAYALLVDCRDQAAVQGVRKAMNDLQAAGMLVELLFLDCQDEVVAIRFRQTRRPHPLIKRGSTIKTVAEALEQERILLSDLRVCADRIVDTSTLSPHELRRIVERFAEHQQLGLDVTVLTFGFKYGVPQDIDLLVDVRFLPNPHFETHLKDHTGLNSAVSDYVFAGAEADEFVARYFSLLEFLLPRYEDEGKRYLTLAVGCTGGKHRSVAVGKRFTELFMEQGREVVLRHRDIERS